MPSLPRWEFHGNCWKRRKKKSHSSSNSETFSTRFLLVQPNRPQDKMITTIASNVGNEGLDGEMEETVGVPVAAAAVSHQVVDL